MTLNKTKMAEVLFPMLSEFHSISDRELQAVWQVYTEGSVDHIVLNFGSIALAVTADEDDDSIDFRVADPTDFRNPDDFDVSHLEPWKRFIGKSFGWGWVTVNQQGYCDGLLLSFEGVTPQVVLNVMASSIGAGLITRV